MRLPSGYKDYDTKVARFLSPIYSLKQSGRNNIIDEFLIRRRFNRLQANNCVYIYNNDLILILYVDDIILFARSIDKINKVKILSEYEMKDFSKTSYLLGITIEQITK